MESGLKGLFLRRRSKSRPPAGKDTSQDAFQQTSSYATVSSGPPPKIGALPLKPSQEKQTRMPLAHSKTKSDELQQVSPGAESANIGRPRTSAGVKPYFVGVSKPNSSALPSGPSSRRTSIGVATANGASRPPVPALPRGLDNLRGPRYHDIMQFASKQQISRTTFNEHIATRNMALPRKSVDIFETEVNQVSGGRYNEYVAMRNIELTRQSIDCFEEDVALRNPVPPDTQHSSIEAARASTEGRRYHSRDSSVDNTANKTTAHRVISADTSANIQVSRTGKGKPLNTENSGHILGSDVGSKRNALRLQSAQPAKHASHSRQHSSRLKNLSGDLSSIPQSRVADVTPPEWLSRVNTAVSSDARTRSMTAAIPPRFPNLGTVDVRDSKHHRANEEFQTPAQRFWDGRHQPSHHSTSRSMSMLEASPGRDAFRPNTAAAPRIVFTERSMLRERPFQGASNGATAKVPSDMRQASAGSDTSFRAPSTGKSTTSSIKKRIDVSGRTVMDLTDERGDRSADNANRSIHHDLAGESQRRTSHNIQTPNLSRGQLEPSTVSASENLVLSETDASKLPPLSRTVSPQVGKSDESYVTSTLPLATAPSKISSPATLSGNSRHSPSAATSKSVGVCNATDSQAASLYDETTIAIDSVAGKSRKQEQIVHQDWDETAFQQPEQVYATPESLKSSDFTDPSRAFGVTARDFAVSPIHKRGQGTSKQAPGPQEEAGAHKHTPILTKLPAKQDKVVHHISSFTLPAKQPRARRSSQDAIAFDEDAFGRKQAEARLALLKLERDLQENFSFAFDSLKNATAHAEQSHLHDLALEDGAAKAPVSRFSSIGAPGSGYQNKAGGTTSQRDTSPGERSLQGGPSSPGLPTGSNTSAANAPSTLRTRNRNSAISTISESEAELPSPVEAAPAPAVALSSAYDRGRTIAVRQSMHRRMNSTASTGSGASAFSVPPHLVPERTSSLKDGDLPPFYIGDAGWE